MLALKSTKLGAAAAPRNVALVNGTEAEGQAAELADSVFRAVGAEPDSEEAEEAVGWAESGGRSALAAGRGIDWVIRGCGRARILGLG